MNRLAIAVPTHMFVAPQMAQSLARMCLMLRDVEVVGVRFFGNAVSTFGRNELVRWAMEEGASHVLWIDTDSVFPPRSAQALIDSGVPFIGANFALKDGSRESAAWGRDGQRLLVKQSGIEEVSTLGFGLTLTHVHVLGAVGSPWFKVVDGEGGGPADEWRFCNLARDKGFPPHVDHGLSLECAHVGLWPHTLPGSR